MIHSELVTLAKNWLLTAKHCNPVFTERGSAKTGEMPDVIGWSSNGSIIVECKTSLIDFRADTKKTFRIAPETGMGQFRYFLFARELYATIPQEELPDGWGIITTCYNNTTRFVNQMIGQVRLKHSKEWQFDSKAELWYLRSRILEIQRFGR